MDWASSSTRSRRKMALMATWLPVFLVVAFLPVFTEQSSEPTSPALFTKRMLNGELVTFSSEYLANKILDEEQTWHWMPWHGIRTVVVNDTVTEAECLPNAESFPDGLFTDEQLRRGAIIVYFALGIYAFTLLALVCNDFFIPCVELICEDLKIPENVAAATFMAVATSCPEFFVNVISTFITESDLGLGTIVGSAIFNTLGVAAIGGIAAIYPIAIDPRPVTRDCIIYMINVSILVTIIWDSVVMWYEALVLACLYVVYFIVMFNSAKLFKVWDKLKKLFKCCWGTNTFVVNNIRDTKESDTGVRNEAFDNHEKNSTAAEDVEKSDMKPVAEAASEKTVDKDEKSDEDEERSSIWRWPRKVSKWQFFWFFYSWPCKAVLRYTIPSPRTRRRWYPLAFFLCICWIGVNSYLVTWSMSRVGTTFNIPDTIVGMTLLAMGGCLPEACAIFIMSRKGDGAMGVSNSLGANSLAILFSLGLPWFIRCIVDLARGLPGQIQIDSAGIDFIVASLLLAVFTLWVVLKIGKFFLRKVTGFTMAIFYLIFISFAIMLEWGVFFETNLQQC